MSANAQAKLSVLSGRYAIYGEIASGGMASVLYGRLIGPVGFARPVAIKRLHPHIAREPSVVSMFIDEAHICARVSHANVVPTLDVIEAPNELALVMEYVHGCTLETLLELLLEKQERMPLNIAGALILGVLHGLAAAHEARNERGEPLHIVHRDVSPQNIILGVDGIPRVFDFGIAKARGRLRSTPSGEVKGKLSYMAPEQLSAAPMDARVDVYGAAAVLWEMLTGRMLFDGDSESAIVHAVLYGELKRPSSLRNDVSETLDALVLRGLARDPDQRFASAREMARALERVLVPASQSEVSEWLNGCAGDRLRARSEWLRAMQRAAEQSAPPTQDAAQQVDETRFTGDPHGRTVSTLGRRIGSKPLRQRWWLLGAALLAACALALLLTRSAAPKGKQETRSRDAAARASRAEPRSTAAPSAEQPSALPAGAPVAAQASDSGYDAQSSPVPDHAATAHEAEARTRRAAKANRPGPAGEKPRMPDCREPYVIDALGVKRWKRECL